jgi:hypothetical protein
LLFPGTYKKDAKNISDDSINKGSAALPAQPIAVPAPTPVLEAPSAPGTVPVPALETAQKIKVIGNSDSKRYHLSGMKYYTAVKANHRVEFDSEADAIKAGYNKAPQ